MRGHSGFRPPAEELSTVQALICCVFLNKESSEEYIYLKMEDGGGRQMRRDIQVVFRA